MEAVARGTLEKDFYIEEVNLNFFLPKEADPIFMMTHLDVYLILRAYLTGNFL